MKKSKIKIKSNNYILFFDDFCPLCISTIKFLKIFVKPKNINYQAISISNLPTEDKNKALEDMLLKSNDGSTYWGYNTYKKLFYLSSSKLSILFKLIGFMMQFPIIKIIGKLIYNRISRNRRRCNNSCNSY